MLKSPLFEKGHSDWLIELPYVTKNYNNTTRDSKVKTPSDGSKKVKEMIVFFNLEVQSEKLKPEFELGDLFKTAAIKNVFSKGD